MRSQNVSLPSASGKCPDILTIEILGFENGLERGADGSGVDPVRDS